MAVNFDLVIKNGRVIDGTGSPYCRSDIGIVKGKIVKIGRINTRAPKEIDANNLIVSPGFIDLHSHTDMFILPFPEAESFILQGVTTQVGGNCGLGLAPINKKTLPLLQRYLEPSLQVGYDYGWDWNTLANLYERIEKQGTSINLIPLVPQGAVRLAVKGFDTTPASKSEMRQMKKLVAEGLEWGAFGMSTGLIYAPGSYSTTEELIELASVLPEYGGIYASHIRNEGVRLMESAEEAIKIGELNDIPVQISHFKAAGKANWGKVNATLRELERARARGVPVSCDVYPYIAGSSAISSALPIWSLEGGIEKMLTRLEDKEQRRHIIDDLKSGKGDGGTSLSSSGWGGIFIAGCRSDTSYEGKSLEQILREKGRLDDPYDGFLDWLIEVKGNARSVSFYGSEDDLRTVMTHPLACIGSDGRAMTPKAGGRPHPRFYGTFPRVLGKYVREEKLFSLEEAVRKMTSLPATFFGIQDRGILREGLAADITVFDPEKIIDKATYENPHQYAEGISYVVVNGEVVVDNGKHTGKRPGKILKR
jgi:N-acyl-D-amino-acid deacylase